MSTTDLSAETVQEILLALAAAAGDTHEAVANLGFRDEPIVVSADEINEVRNRNRAQYQRIEDQWNRRLTDQMNVSMLSTIDKASKALDDLVVTIQSTIDGHKHGRHVNAKELGALGMNLASIVKMRRELPEPADDTEKRPLSELLANLHRHGLVTVAGHEDQQARKALRTVPG